MKTIFRNFILAAAFAVLASAQLTTTTTTLSSAVVASTTTQWCVASATGISVPSVSAAGTILFVDKEAAQVTSAGGTSTCFNVRRGQLGTSANYSHSSGSTVYVGNPATGTGDTSRPFSGVFTPNMPTGSCVATAQYSLPIVVTGSVAGVGTGQFWDCVNQQWTNITPMTRLLVTGTTQASGTSPSAATAASTVTGGTGGAQSATTGSGGAGAAISSTGGIGGAGGSSSGTGGAGGAVSYVAGAGGGTVTGGTGGLSTVGAGAGGNGSTAGGTGGGLNIYSGAAGTGGTGTSGAVNIRSGGAAATAVFTTSTAGASAVASVGTNQNVSISPSGTGTVNLTGGTDPTKTVRVDASGATTGTAATLTAAQAGNISVALPINTGALTTAYFCGSTSGNAACANTATGGTARVIGGIATLASNAAVISSLVPTFTSTATYTCVANDLTTRANPVQVANTSSSSITITNTTGASDVINWLCVGY